MKAVRLFSVVAAFALASAAFAVDVNVDSTVAEVAGTSYQTIAGALTYVAGQSAPRTIHIVAGGPYNESLLIGISVTIEGDSYRPIIVTPPITGSPAAGTIDNNGVGIYTDASSGGDITVVLKNMVIIPDASNPPNRGLRINNNDGANLTADQIKVGLDDVLITSNDGSNNPVSTDGLSKVDLTGATEFHDDTIFVTGYADLACTGTICTNSYGASLGTSDGIVFFPDVAGHTLWVGPGCVFSYMNRIGIQVATDGSIVRLKGTAANPIIIQGNHQNATANSGLAMYQDNNSIDSADYELDYVLFRANNTGGIWCLYVDDTDSVAKLTANHCAFVDNADAAIWVGDNLTEPWVFNDCTFVNNGIGSSPSFPQAIVFQDGGVPSSGSVTFKDCIFAGNGGSDSTGGANTIENDSTALSIVFDHSDVALTGAYKLANAFTLGTGATTPALNNTLVSDPMLLDVNNYSSSQWLGVDNGSFATAASDGGPLHGYGPFVGSYVITGAKGTWTLYE